MTLSVQRPSSAKAELKFDCSALFSSLPARKVTNSTETKILMLYVVQLSIKLGWLQKRIWSFIDVSFKREKKSTWNWIFSLSWKQIDGVLFRLKHGRMIRLNLSTKLRESFFNLFPFCNNFYNQNNWYKGWYNKTDHDLFSWNISSWKKDIFLMLTSTSHNAPPKYEWQA